MARIIGVVSGKGGVGKTTLVSNLAAALSELNQDVVAIDANLTTPNLGMHLGLHLVPNTLHDILKDRKSTREATYSHPLGFKIIPASMNTDDLNGVDVGKLPEVALNMQDNADYVLLDSAAGLGREAVNSILASSEVLLIVTPDIPSVADALKAARIATENNKKIIGVVVNRIRNRPHELKRDRIEMLLDLPVIAEIPEDGNVSRSISVKTPLIQFSPDSPASVEMRRLAYYLCDFPFRYKRPGNPNLIQKLVSWMIR